MMPTAIWMLATAPKSSGYRRIYGDAPHVCQSSPLPTVTALSFPAVAQRLQEKLCRPLTEQLRVGAETLAPFDLATEDRDDVPSELDRIPGGADQRLVVVVSDRSR